MTSNGEPKVEFPPHELDDKVIPLWLIVFDQDPTKTYICVTRDKVLASIEGAIRGALGDDAAVDCLVSAILEKLGEVWQQSFINLTCPSLSLFVHRLEIDRYNPIGKILLECYDALTYDDLRARIAKLFIDPASLCG